MFICYGERSNRYLMIEYGFACRNNCYDFYRAELKTYDFSHEQSMLEELLRKNRMKSNITCDLKKSGLHKDMLVFMRCVKTKQSQTDMNQSEFAWEPYSKETELAALQGIEDFCS